MNKWAIFGALALLAALLVASLAVVLRIDITPEVEKGKPVVRTRNFGEGLKLSRKGLYGIDLVSIGKAHMRKVRKGPFTIGALNELVLEEVSLALPEELWGEKKGEGEVQATADGEGASRPKAMLSKLGVDVGRLKLGEKIPRFSALSIRNLAVSRVVGTNAVPWFAAANAKAERAGLALSSGWSVENGVSNAWKEAFLTVEPKLELHHP